MTGYFDSLADVLPPEVIAAMHKAAADATHHGKGREGEPVFLASVRELISRTVLKSEHDKQVHDLVQLQRADAQVAAEHLAHRVNQVRGEAREASRRLELVRGLVDHRRKTLPMGSLVGALDTPIQ